MAYANHKTKNESQVNEM